MTINIADNSPRISYAVAAGVTQTSFSVPFEFFADASLNVYVDSVLQTLITDYTVSGGDGSTGSISMSVTGISGGSTVVITRSITLERTTDFPTSGPFQINALNTELDRMIAIAADLQDQTDRSLKLTDYDASVNLVLPDLNTRKGTTLAFNSVTGAVEAGPSVAGVTTIAALSADIATLADIEDGTVATDAISDLAAISSDVSTVSSVSGSVTTVAGISSDVTAVAADATDIGTVSANITNVNTVAGISSDVTTVAGIDSDVTAVAADSADIGTVSSNIADVNTAATNIADINTAAANIVDIQNASANAATATAQAAAAATSASNALTSENNAATSASAAAASQTAAAASAASAASAYDSFDDRYLGPKSADPTLDNDGNALVAGALYFNSTANEMRVYDGANWIAASSAGGASLLNYNYTATAGQTTFSGADDNAATLSYTQQNLIVTLNGIVLEDGTDYTASNGTSIVLATGASAGDELNIVAFKSFTTADMVPASTGGTFSAPVTIDGNSATVLTVDRATTDGTIINVQRGGTTVGSIGSTAGVISYINLDPRSGGTGVGATNTDSVIPVTGTGANADASKDLGITSSRWRDLYLSGGVYLGGTGSANKLDDYEEGTWTPSLNAGTFSSVGATYTKIGRLVTITLDGTVGTGGGSQITNLPFTTGVTTATAMYTSGQNFSSGRTVPIAVVGGGSTTLYIRDIGDNVAFAGMALTAGAGISFNITYYVN